MWPDEKVVRFVTENFLPARLHVRDDAEAYKRYAAMYDAQWTPTILELDADGTERHRVEGFLPKEEFLPQLELGLATAEFKAGSYGEAAARFRHVAEKHAESSAAPEALYWAGVARYKESGDNTALKETARAFSKRFTDSSWAQKASVWKG